MLEPLDVNRETLVQLAELVERFGVAKTTVWRWVKYGNQGIFLAARRIGGRWYTSEDAFQRFCDQVSLVSLGERSPTQQANLAPVAAPFASTSSKQRREADRSTNRQLRIMGMDGDGAIFKRSTVANEILCDLHEYLEQWMPGSERSPEGAYKAVRSGIFTKAVSMLEGRDGPKKSLKAVIQWIETIDLLSFDVRSLPGIGPGYESGWAALLSQPEFAAKIKRLPVKVS